MNRAAKIAFPLALAFTLVMAVLPNLPHPPGAEGDKIEHIAAFVTLSVLGMLAYPARPLRLLFGLLVFGALIEVVQAIPMLHRDSELADLLVDTFAAVLTISAVYWAQRRSRG